MDLKEDFDLAAQCRRTEAAEHCGPQPFMVSIYHELLKWGIPASQVHFEFFGPRQELERAAWARV